MNGVGVRSDLKKAELMFRDKIVDIQVIDQDNKDTIDAKSPARKATPNREEKKEIEVQSPAKAYGTA